MNRISCVACLFIAILLSFNKVQAQIDLPQYTGIYVTFKDLPAVLQTKPAYSQLLNQISNKFETDSTVVAFPRAKGGILRKTNRIHLRNPKIYPLLQSLLESNPLVESTELIGNNVVATTSLIRNPSGKQESSALPPTPECGSPYSYNDPGAISTNHIDYMQLPCAWSLTQGSPAISIGVVDNYFHPTHPDLSGKIDGVYGNTFLGSDNHGTAVAGGAAGIVNNNLCVAGAGFNSHVNLYGWAPGIVEQMLQAHYDGNPIITVSVSNTSWLNGSKIAREAALEITRGGSLITFAVNGANGTPFVDIPGVIMVGQGWEDGAYKPYNYGIEDIGMEIIVPILNSSRLQDPNGQVCAIGPANSSMAAPHVAGVAALMLDINPCLTPMEIEDLLTAESNTNSIRNANDPNWAHLLDGVGYMNAYKAVIAAQNYTSPPKFTVYGGQSVVIDQKLHASYKTIEIKTGGMLTITNSFLSMHEEGRIVVNRGAKLLVRNSTITRVKNPYCTADPRWKGIFVAGNNKREQPNMYYSNGTLNANKSLSSLDAGVAMLLEGTTISHATQGLSTEIPAIPYADQVARWGGLYIADRAKFIDNWKAVAFMKYPDPSGNYSFINKSKFTDCYFVNTDINDLILGGAGITVWDNDGIEISGCVFENLRLGAYGGLDAGVSFLGGNTFILDQYKSGHKHIEAKSTSPFATYLKIGSSSGGMLPNRFISTVSGDNFIYSDATDGGEGGIIIDNNEFLTSNGNRAVDPIKLLGPSRYTIENNLFETGEPSIYVYKTGQNQYTGRNVISCNTFYLQKRGIYYANDNNGSIFRNNAFNTSVSAHYDVRVYGKVDQYQGSYTNPANNCFSESNKDIETSYATEPFYYYYNNSPICQVPSTQTGFTAISTSYNSDYCNQQTSENMEDISIAVDIAEIHDQLAWLNKSSGKESDHRYLLSKQISYTLDSASHNIKNPTDLDKLVNKIIQMNDPDILIRGYGLLVKYGKYNEATKLLHTLESFTEFLHFTKVQKINLSRLTAVQNTQLFQFSLSDRRTLGAAVNDSRAASYARALLYLSGDTSIYNEKGTNNRAELEMRMPTGANTSDGYKLYPNPSSESVFVEFTNPDSRPVSLKVFDSAGKQIGSYSSVYNGQQIPIDHLYPGVFVFQFINGGTTVNRRLVVQR
ncbi:S8 family serine peptidase [Lewinella sp. IMCC34191]|uniref:S8 family serine peptidase n=1 Tax=Lewinella sp. IMCC34191 TaxID=2259172 RepID=UPI000E27F2EA|nr:S8 family serine peptidase [Lewinella sp. IMCC34191]